MDFKNSQAIYLQIADFVCDKVLEGEWPAGERIPSVRDLAVSLEVNPNTVMRTYERLQEQEIIYNKRGIGYFLAEDAVQKIKRQRKNDFFQVTLPDIYRNMLLLDVSMNELQKGFDDYQANNK